MGNIADTLTKRFHDLDLDWALAEDSAKAVLRVAADPMLNGTVMYFLRERALN
jgi:hypothetical protein